VSIAEQVLVAYEGTRAVFATLVSTGADRRGSQTPTGAFRIWAKLATSDMDDLERTDVESNYLIEGVPWVQYFSGGIALHAAFWHDDFGHRRSHGCVNLSPRDARFLYAFTRPNVPDGFSAYIPDADERPTIVRVRP
jgi:lipoprotein-anchoring transpeptidase ErfK/SrfK